MFNVLKLLEEEGYINEGEDNIIYAEKAFFAARVMKWIRDEAQADPNFNLASHLTILMYYKSGLAELKLDEDGLTYRMKENPEVDEFVHSLTQAVLGDLPPSSEPPASEPDETP
jgi:hypothetical protein